jgi:hypothetical protein
MTRTGPAALAALVLALAGGPVQASVPATPPLTADPLPALFIHFFYEWKSEPKDLQVSDLRVLNAGGALRVLCGAYALPGQSSRPFLVLGDSTPKASAAWEPGSFPENDPLYPQLMDNLRLCQRLGAAVSAS